MGIFFWGCLYFTYFFFGMPGVPDIFWGLTVDAGSKPTSEAKMRVLPRPWGIRHSL